MRPTGFKASRRARRWAGSMSSSSVPRSRSFVPTARGTTAGQTPLARALKGEIVRQEEIVLRQSGQHRELSVNAAPLAGQDGTIVGAVAVAQDISERKRVENRLRQQSGFTGAVTNSMGEGLYAIDTRGPLDLHEPRRRTDARLDGRRADRPGHARGDPSQEAPTAPPTRSRNVRSGRPSSPGSGSRGMSASSAGTANSSPSPSPWRRSCSTASSPAA